MQRLDATLQLSMERDAVQDYDRRLRFLREIVSYFNTSDAVDDLGPHLASGENKEAFQSIEDQIVGEFTYWAGAAFALASLKKLTGECQETCSPQEFWPILRNSMENISVLLDLGVGIRPNFFLGQDTTICVELFDGYLKHLKNSMTSTKMVVVKDDVLAFLERQPSRSIETIVVTDLIEHLSRESGLKLIKELKRVVSVQALVVTPKGFLPQHVGEGEDEGWGFIGNQLQNHVSGWDVDDFQGWAILLAPDYYLDIGHSEGVLGAIFTQTPKQGQELVFVVEPIAFGSDDELALNLLFEALDQVKLLGTKFPCRFIMPTPMSPKSKLINPRKRLPEGEFNFASFNPEVNNALAAGVLPNFVSFPGTVHYYLHQVNADYVIVVQGKENTGINYSKFLASENLLFLNLDYRNASTVLKHLQDLNECSIDANTFLELWDVQKSASA